MMMLCMLFLLYVLKKISDDIISLSYSDFDVSTQSLIGALVMTYG